MRHQTVFPVGGQATPCPAQPAVSVPRVQPRRVPGSPGLMALRLLLPLASHPPPAILGWGPRSITPWVPVPPWGPHSITSCVPVPPGPAPGAPCLDGQAAVAPPGLRAVLVPLGVAAVPCPLPWSSTGRGTRPGIGAGWGQVGACRIRPSVGTISLCTARNWGAGAEHRSAVAAEELGVVAPAEGALGSVSCPCCRQGHTSFHPQHPGTLKNPPGVRLWQGRGDPQPGKVGGCSPTQTGQTQLRAGAPRGTAPVSAPQIKDRGMGVGG